MNFFMYSNFRSRCLILVLFQFSYTCIEENYSGARVCLSVCLSVRLSVCLFVSVSVCQCVRLSVYLSVNVYVRLSVVCQSVYLSIFFVNVSAYLLTWMCVIMGHNRLVVGAPWDRWLRRWGGDWLVRRRWQTVGRIWFHLISSIRTLMMSSAAAASSHHH